LFLVEWRGNFTSYLNNGSLYLVLLKTRKGEEKQFNREKMNKIVMHSMQVKLKGTYDIKIQHSLYQTISHIDTMQSMRGG